MLQFIKAEWKSLPSNPCGKHILGISILITCVVDGSAVFNRKLYGFIGLRLPTILAQVMAAAHPMDLSNLARWAGPPCKECQILEDDCGDGLLIHTWHVSICQWRCEMAVVDIVDFISVTVKVEKGHGQGRSSS